MLFRIPIVVTQTKTGYSAKPLFVEYPAREDSNLNRLQTRLARQLVEHLEELGKQSRQDTLAEWTFSPSVTVHRSSLSIELRRQVVKVKYLLVAFDHFKRRIVFAPAIPDLWFEVHRGDILEERASAVLTDYWRKVERDAVEDEKVEPDKLSLTGKAWVESLDLNVRTNLPIPKKSKFPFMMFGGDSKPDGAQELRSVGRCLDQLYPDELDRAVLREREVKELGRLLQSRERRPVLLLGPRKCGKTAIIHETVYQRVIQKRRKEMQKSNVWLISPQRLISGMSYVGQWEGRLLAILKHVRKRKHVLYFDDLVGLFLAGQTSQTSLSVAMVLKPYLEQRLVRFLGEITPEQLRVLQERDRGFADLFHIVPIHEPNDTSTSRILIDQQRRLEHKHGCNFALDAIPTVIDLTRRYERDSAFPGKAAAILNRLAVRFSMNRNAESTQVRDLENRPLVNRDDVLADLASRSGLSLAFLDPKQRLDRDDVRKQLVELVIGQDAAVEALADVVSIAKARLNDPDRPLASFLFLGPTGVGKTECAKATARVLFGDAERLLRIDLNEFNQPGSAARLVGTFSQPEGLLTAAVRRQPFAVILLDEIEKADRDVFDVLLQVLGEGRLTDALGRTADFTNAIILMTSNLGVREAEGNLGFGSPSDKGNTYTQAAEKFFRPEFFNRLDRVIPFRKLTREEMGRIAQRLVSEVLAREGFSQRQCVLNVTPEAIERVIDSGYDPALGARAMKRAVERELTKPAAAKLASLAIDDLSIITVRTNGPALAIDVRVPGFVPKVVHATGKSREERLEKCHELFASISEQVATIRPAGPIGSNVTPEQERYFTVKERLDVIAEKLNEIEERAETERMAKMEGGTTTNLGRRPRYRLPTEAKGHDLDGGSALRVIMSAFAMEEAMDELFATVEIVEDDEIEDLEQQLALVRLMANAPITTKQTYFHIRDFSGANHAKQLRNYYRVAWTHTFGIEFSPPDSKNPDRAIQLHGIHARSFALTEAGTHLFLPKHGGPIPVRVDVLDEWPMTLPDPDSFGPIVRIYPEGKPMIDIRTGLVGEGSFKPEAFRQFTLAALPRE